MKYILWFWIVLFFTALAHAQVYDPQRIQDIEDELTALEIDIPGLSEKIDIAMHSANLSTFLIAISEVHRLNMDVDNTLNSTQIINNFRDVTVLDVLVYLCKNYNLAIDFTGTILYVAPYQEVIEAPKKREIPISYDPASQNLSADLKNDNLAEAFKLISDRTSKGLFFTPDLDSKTISTFIKDLPFDIAMEKIAYSNDLVVSKTKDGSFEFQKLFGSSGNGSGASTTAVTRPKRPRRASFFFEVIDRNMQRIDVDFVNVLIADIVYDIGNDLALNIFTASPLDNAGVATVKAKDITFDELLTKIFENNTTAAGTSQTTISGTNPSTASSERFTFKKEDGVYYFGTYKQLTLRASEIVPLRYRSIGILADPQRTGRSAGRTTGSSGFNNFNDFSGGFNNPGRTTTTSNTSQTTTEAADISSLIPDDVKKDLEIISDKELNSFIVSGASADIERFKTFVAQIDKPIPVVIIEVMILEIGENATIDAGIEWGLGTSPTTTQGAIFPNTDLTLGATTINRILGRIGGSSFFNIGKVSANFFINIRASESNGNFRIRSSPRIATLNGHRAYFSNGQTDYFAITRNTLFGAQNPASSESTIFQPIDAELSLDVLPFVSADGEITMDIKVIQSSFSGERITETGPPGISSREFTSIVKARNNDIVVLGGLEEKSKNDSGSGVPFLAKVPLIKYLFSKRTRTASTSKLTVLIKPTVVY